MSKSRLKIIHSEPVRSMKGDVSNDGYNAVTISFNRTITPIEAAGCSAIISQFLGRAHGD